MSTSEFDIKRVMNSLKGVRPAFYSEADFQFALAWHIKELYPKAELRLEYICKELDNMHIDVLVIINKQMIPIELKYKTKGATVVSNEETYVLKNQGASNLGRYDFVRDINRIEQCQDKLSSFSKGYAIMITNDSIYYNKPTNNRVTMSDKFRIHEGKKLPLIAKWTSKYTANNVKGKKKSFRLKRNYIINWEYYSIIESNEFKYTIVEIK